MTASRRAAPAGSGRPGREQPRRSLPELQVGFDTADAVSGGRPGQCEHEGVQVREFSVPPIVTVGDAANLTDPVWDNAEVAPTPSSSPAPPAATAPSPPGPR